MRNFIAKVRNYYEYDNLTHILVAIVGLIVRFYLLSITIKATFAFLPFILVIGISFVINAPLEKFFHYISYKEVGIFYRSGENPIIGSLLYTSVYLLNCIIIFELLEYLINIIF